MTSMDEYRQEYMFRFERSREGILAAGLTDNISVDLAASSATLVHMNFALLQRIEKLEEFILVCTNANKGQTRENEQ